MAEMKKMELTEEELSKATGGVTFQQISTQLLAGAGNKPSAGDGSDAARRSDSGDRVLHPA